MPKILFLSHINNKGDIDKHAYEVLSAVSSLANDMGADLCLGLFGENVNKTQILPENINLSLSVAVRGEEYKDSRYASDIKAMQTIYSHVSPDFILLPASSRIQKVVAGLAYRVQGKIDTHVTALSYENSQLYIHKWFYRQRLETTITRAEKPWFITVDRGHFAVAPSKSYDLDCKFLDVKADEAYSATQVLGEKEPAHSEQTINPDAELLFVAGAGWTKKQADGSLHVNKAAELILDFLKKTKASLGGSKSIVDMGTEGESVLPFMTHLNQIGQTGSTPSHPKGLATCCHGEEPHAVGWRFIQERRAVNLDPNCGWARGKADVLYVADAFELMEELNKLF